MTISELYDFRTNKPEPCDGCNTVIPDGEIAFGRKDGGVFCARSCESKHPNAKPRGRAARELQGSGL